MTSQDEITSEKLAEWQDMIGKGACIEAHEALTSAVVRAVDRCNEVERLDLGSEYKRAHAELLCYIIGANGSM